MQICIPYIKENIFFKEIFLKNFFLNLIYKDVLCQVFHLNKETGFY